MTIADELRKLHDLYRTGALTDNEFAAAKAAIPAQGETGAGRTGPARRNHPLSPDNPRDR
jgi:hypothetical protein